MAPFRHDLQNQNYLKLTERGELVLYLAKQDKFIVISHDGTQIKYGAKTEFALAQLPDKLKPWYGYARKAVEVMRKKTPYLVYKDKVKVAMMMVDGSYLVTMRDNANADKC